PWGGGGGHGDRPVGGAGARGAARRPRLGGGRAPPRPRGSTGRPGSALRDRAAPRARRRPHARGTRGGPRERRRGSGRMRRILVVEDNPDLAYGLRNNLEIEGYTVEVAGDGGDGLARARATAPDLIILDLKLPGLRLGADDYVTKPFGVLELLARVEALLRRGAPQRDDSAPGPTRFGDVEVVPATRQVLRNGAPVALTPKEFDLLAALLRRRGAVATRAELLAEVWGYSAAVLSRTVDTHIAELRRKLEPDPAAPRHILTVRKTGYRLEP